MNNSLRILILEDDPNDVELLERFLCKTYPDCDIAVAHEYSSFESLLVQKDFEIILADYELGEYTALDALRFLKEAAQEIPFIVVTGTLRDQDAVGVIKAGATDFVSKNRLDELPKVIAKAFDEFDVIKKKRRLEWWSEALAQFNSRMLNEAPWSEKLQRALEPLFKDSTIDGVSLCTVESDDLELLSISSDVSLFRTENGIAKLAPFTITDNGLMKRLQLTLNHQPRAIPINGFNGVFPFFDGNQDLNVILPIPIEAYSDAYGMLFLHFRNERDLQESDISFSLSLASTLSRFIERKLHFEGVERSRYKFQTLIQSGVDLIGVINEEGVYTYISKNVTDSLGYEPEELIGKSPFDFIHPDYQEESGALFQEILNGKQQLTSPAVLYRKKNGDYIYLKSTLTNKLDDEVINGVIANSVDITEVTLQSKALSEANSRYKYVALATHDHVYDWNVIDNTVVNVADTVQGLLGYKVDVEGDGDFWLSIIHNSDLPVVKQKVESAFKDENMTSLSHEYRVRKADGTYLHILDTSYFLRNQKGKVVRQIGAIRDITEKVHQNLRDHFFVRLSNAASTDGNLEEVVKGVLQEFIGLSSIDQAEWWQVSTDGERFHFIDSLGEFKKSSFKVSSLRVGEGFIGRVLSNKKLQFLSLSDENANFLRIDEYLSKGFQTAIGIPIYNKQDMGVFVLYSQFDARVYTKLKPIIQDVSKVIAPLLSHKIAREELNHFMAISPDLLALIGFDGTFKRVNDAFSKLLGYSKHSYFQKDVLDFVHDEHQTEAKTLLNIMRSESVVKPKPIQFVAKNGQTRWISWTSASSPRENVIYAVGKDITDQYKTELELRDAYSKLQKAQALAKLGYWTRFLDKDVSYWSDETYVVFGVDKETFTPALDNVKQLLHPDDRHLINVENIHALKAGVENDFEVRLNPVNGDLRWVHYRVNLILDDKGKPLKIEGAVQDITEQKLYEDNLQRVNERFKLAISAGNEVVWEWDCYKNEVSRNGKFSRPVSFEEFEDFKPNDSWFSLISEQDRKRVYESMLAAKEDGSVSEWSEEYEMNTPSGNAISVSDRAYISRDRFGKPIRIVGVAIDITTSKIHLKEISEQNRKLKEIAWLQSHTVRAPLSNIMGLVGILSNESSLQSTQMDMLTLLDKSAKDLDEVINEIVKKASAIEK